MSFPRKSFRNPFEMNFWPLPVHLHLILSIDALLGLPMTFVAKNFRPVCFSGEADATLKNWNAPDFLFMLWNIVHIEQSSVNLKTYIESPMYCSSIGLASQNIPTATVCLLGFWIWKCNRICCPLIHPRQIISRNSWTSFLGLIKSQAGVYSISCMLTIA